MKYPVQTINLAAGVSYSITTTIVTEPYNVFVIDSTGNDITASIGIIITLVLGVYVVTLYSDTVLNAIKVYILY